MKKVFDSIRPTSTAFRVISTIFDSTPPPSRFESNFDSRSTESSSHASSSPSANHRGSYTGLRLLTPANTKATLCYLRSPICYSEAAQPCAAASRGLSRTKKAMPHRSLISSDFDDVLPSRQPSCSSATFNIGRTRLQKPIPIGIANDPLREDTLSD